MKSQVLEIQIPMAIQDSGGHFIRIKGEYKTLATGCGPGYYMFQLPCKDMSEALDILKEIETTHKIKFENMGKQPNRFKYAIFENKNLSE